MPSSGFLFNTLHSVPVKSGLAVQSLAYKDAAHGWGTPATPQPLILSSCCKKSDGTFEVFGTWDSQAQAAMILLQLEGQVGRTSCAFTLFLGVVVTIGPSLMGNSQSTKLKAPLRVHEDQIDLSNRQGKNISSCATIYPDGRYHLERKVQELQTLSVSISIYEDVISTSQRDYLQKMIDSSEVRDLPHYSYPAVPRAAQFLHHFDLQIGRDNEVQAVGFVIWRGPNETYSIEGAPANIRDAQFKSERILTPIVDWFHY
jgi:hypothetical protein